MYSRPSRIRSTLEKYVSCASTPGGGTAVSGQSWPAALAYVAESEGDYRCVLDHDAAFALGQTYEAEISAVAGSGLVATWFFLFTVLARRS